jgi:hypothetical protein
MSVLTRRKLILIAIVVPLEIVSAVFAWRDLRSRSDDELRGPKRFWRLVIVANPGNSVLYWLLGRREGEPA